MNLGKLQPYRHHILRFQSKQECFHHQNLVSFQFFAIGCESIHKNSIQSNPKNRSFYDLPPSVWHCELSITTKRLKSRTKNVDMPLLNCPLLLLLFLLPQGKHMRPRTIKYIDQAYNPPSILIGIKLKHCWFFPDLFYK